MRNTCVFVAASLGVALLSACGSSGPALVPPSQLSPAAPAFAPSDDSTGGDLYAAGVKVTPDFRDFGHAPRATKVRLSIMLRYQHESELEALVQAQSDRASPYFRRYLTNAEFNAYFAPSAQAERM